MSLTFVFSLPAAAPGSCFVNGREHFNTFDNTGYRFSGPCSSMLVLDSENPEEFKVVLNGDPNCDINNPCQKSLDLIVDGINVHLGRKTNTSFVVRVEGKAVDLPHTTAAPYMKKVTECCCYFTVALGATSQMFFVFHDRPSLNPSWASLIFPILVALLFVIIFLVFCVNCFLFV